MTEFTDCKIIGFFKGGNIIFTKAKTYGVLDAYEKVFEFSVHVIFL